MIVKMAEMGRAYSMWQRWEMYTHFCSGNLKGRDSLHRR